MSIIRFGDKTDIDQESLIVYENFGITVYIAQLFEGFLSNILTGLEQLGHIDLKEDVRRDNLGYVDENLGSMIRILSDQMHIDRELLKLLKKANFQRNHLVHRFMLENNIDLLNSAGRRSVNDKLNNLRKNLFLAMECATQISTAVWKELGVEPEEVDKKIQEMRRLSEDSDGDADTEK